MFHLVLFEPQIPQNTGNVIRLCANTGCHLHLIRPLGFYLDDRRLRRAGLDYHARATVQVYTQFDEWVNHLHPSRIYAIETWGTRCYSEASFKPEDVLLFGSETKGLPEDMALHYPSIIPLQIPMVSQNRSLNLSNAVSIVVYEAWRQNGFQEHVFSTL